MQSDEKVPAPDRRQTALMMAQFKKATMEPNEHVQFAMSEDNPCIWYIRLRNFAGNNDEYVGGEYDCKMVAPRDFPYKPPSFYFLTNNGLYEIGTKVCISIGEYHADDYRAALGMAGFANQLVSGLIGWRDMGGGINIINTSVGKKKDFAKESRESNIKHHPTICNLIEDTFRGYSAKWDRGKISAELAVRLGIAGGDSS